MANAIRFTSQLFTDTGIQDSVNSKDKSFTVDSITDYKKAEFGDELEENVLDHFLNLCKALNLSGDTEVLNTYTTSNGEFFSIPYVMHDEEDQLCIALGKTTLPLTFANKLYSIEGCPIQFKPLGYLDNDKVLKAAYLGFDIETEIDGMTLDVPYSISCKAKKDIDLKALVMALQKGQPISPDLIGKMGKGGSFTKALKPFMLPKGTYQLLEAPDPVRVEFGTDSFITRSGKAQQIDIETGELIGEPVVVNLQMVPFKSIMLQRVKNGATMLFQIDGGYSTQDGKVSTLGTATIVASVGEELTIAKIKSTAQKFRTEMIAKRRTISSSSILKPEEIEALTAKFLAPKDKATNNVAPVETSIAKTPAFDDIPF